MLSIGSSGLVCCCRYTNELVFEVPIAEVEQTKAVVQEAMEGAAKLSIPLKTSIEVGENWGVIH